MNKIEQLAEIYWGSSYRKCLYLLAFLIVTKLGMIGHEHYSVNKINNDASTTIVKLDIYKIKVDIVSTHPHREDINEKVLTIIAKQGVYEFRHKKGFSVQNGAYLINDNRLCITETLTADCLKLFR